MLTPRAFASSTVLRMVSESPAWNPQAMLTEVASSIMAASLPISHAPNPSPRSQFRSIVMMSCPLSVSGSLLVVRPLLWRLCVRRRRGLPRSGVNGADGGTGNVSTSKHLEVEVRILDVPEAVGQVAQQLRELAGFGLCFGP